MTAAAEEGHQRASVSSESKMDIEAADDEEQEQDEVVKRGLKKRQASILFPTDR